MSIVIHFNARTEQKDEMVQAVGTLAADRGYQTYVQESGLRVRFCPMGDMTMEWEALDQGEQSGNMGVQWLVTGECYSTPAGAGLHKAAVDFLDDLERGMGMSLEVDDSSGYYEHRDFERVKREHFYPWLHSLLRICGEMLGKEEYNRISFCWDVDQYQPEEIPDTVISPMGRFSLSILSDGVERQGIDWFADKFFLWDQKEKDARYYRNTAMNLLWERCYFAPSSRSDDDRECNEEILDALETAFRMDPSLPLPMDAYEEVCGLAGRDPSIPSGAPVLDTGFPVGFRKGLVTYSYGGLRLTLPGSYQYEWEEYDDGGGCDSWWDSALESPTWRLNQYRRREGNAELTERIYRERDLEHLTMKHGEACWGWNEMEEDGEPLYMVTCEAVTGPSLFVITVSYGREEEREGIYELLRKMEAVEETPPVDQTKSYDRE